MLYSSTAIPSSLPSPRACSNVEYLAEPFHIPQSIRTCIRLCNAWRVVTLKVDRYRKHADHPYLFACGLALEHEIGDDSLFLRSIAKIIAVSRAIHSTIQASLKCNEELCAFREKAFRPIAYPSFGYFYALNARVPWQVVQGKIPSSLMIPSPELALLIRRLELIYEQLKVCIQALFELAWRMLELKDMITERDSTPSHDVLIEMHHLYSMYDVHDPDSFLAFIKRASPSLDTTLKELQIPISMHRVLDRIAYIMNKVKEIESTGQAYAYQTLSLARNTASVALSTLSLGSTPRLPHQPRVTYS